MIADGTESSMLSNVLRTQLNYSNNSRNATPNRQQSRSDTANMTDLIHINENLNKPKRRGAPQGPRSKPGQAVHTMRTRSNSRGRIQEEIVEEQLNPRRHRNSPPRSQLDTMQRQISSHRTRTFLPTKLATKRN